MRQPGIHGPSIDLAANTADGGPPALAEWVDIAVVGEWRGHPSGPYNLTRDDLASIKNFFERRYAANDAELVIDFEHQSLVSKLTGRPAPASGWISAMRLVDGGDRLQARVRWNDPARELIESREYRYLSPVFEFEYADPVDGHIWPVVITSVGLTNRPFLTELAPVANSAGGGAQREEGHMDLAKLAQLWQCTPAEAAQRLGVKENSDAATVANSLAALGAKAAELQAKLQEYEKAAKADAERRKHLANALGVDADADETAIKAAIIRLKAPGAGLGQVANALGLSQDAGPDEVLEKVRELQGADREARARRLVANAIEARKVPPANREWWEKQALADYEATAQVLNTMQPIVGEGGTAKAPAGDGASVALTDEEKAVANSLGVDEATAAADKAEFVRNADLAAEFGDLPTYLAFRAGERAGAVKIVNRSA